jgi:hypothetical protein
LEIVENNGFIPNHQFDFREGHSTIERTHHIVQRINEALEKQYCSAAFFDISQVLGSKALPVHKADDLDNVGSSTSFTL